MPPKRKAEPAKTETEPAEDPASGSDEAEAVPEKKAKAKKAADVRT